jgi:natural product precursor
MKTTKFSKKLVLNKKTVANLENGEMKKVQGGKTVVSCPCPDTEFCPTWIFTICSPC